MKLHRTIGLTALALALSVLGPNLRAYAQGKESSVKPTGTWKLTYFRPDGKAQTTQPTLKLNEAGDKLAGTLTRVHNKKEIEMTLKDVKVNGNEISFTVAIPPVTGNGPDLTRKFRGTITGDVMKGTIEEEGMDKSHSLKWEGKRIKK